jgi:exopolysaccharide biosynthesis protein
MLLCAACIQLTDDPQQPIRDTATIEVVTPESQSPQADGWLPLTSGIEQRTITPPQSSLAQMVVVRLDPTQVTFRVHYQPGNPMTLDQWRNALPTAQVIVNANFFTPEHTITGMLVSDGQFYGSSFTDRGGMFSIQNGQPVIQQLPVVPYDGRALEQAVQAFPMLVTGGVAAYNRPNDVRGSRRTVVGMDTSGRVLLMATPGIGLGLHDLSQYLASTNLGLSEAFNLDGGGSTMMYLAPTNYALNSLDPVPAVLAVYSR